MSLLDTASLICTPNGYKEGKLYSVIPSDGSGDMSVTRATTATRVNSAGLVELVPYNLLQYSESFSTAPWGTQQGGTISANIATAPNGTLTADLLYATTNNVIQAAVQSISTANGTAYTQSIYVKASGKNFAALYTLNGSTGTTMWVNLTSGAITNGVGTNVTNRFAESVGDGWWRIGFTDLGNGSVGYMHIYPTDSASTEQATANGTDGILVWGAQLNEGTIKDYQKTETRLNIPRLDYSNGTCPSLLVEPQRTNLLTYSSSFDNAVWNKSNTTISANSAISPSGINDADNLVPNTSNAAHFIENSNYLNLSIGQTYTTSFYAKANGYNFIQFTADGGDISGNPRVNFNLSNGTLGSIDAGITASIQSVGNGWYRCVATYVAAYNVFNNIICVINSSTAARAEAFIGNGTDGVYLWGAQLEAGSYATSYIPTTSASVTRNADNIYKTGISSLIGATEGVIFVDFNNVTNPESGNYNMLATISDSAGYYIYISKRNPTGIEVYGGYNASTYISSGVFVDGQRYKVALAYKNNDFALYINGSLIWLDTSGVINVTAPDKFSLGSYYSQILNLNSGINATALWKTRLTNDELATLTTI